MDRNPNMAKILELKLKWVARDRQNSRYTVNSKDYVKRRTKKTHKDTDNFLVTVWFR
jgi:hypothetical protein